MKGWSFGIPDSKSNESIEHIEMLKKAISEVIKEHNLQALLHAGGIR